MKKLVSLILLSVFMAVIVPSTILSNETSRDKAHGVTSAKSDYREIKNKGEKSGPKIIAVADSYSKEFSYIDMGSAQGVKSGDRFLVEGKYGKIMVQVMQAYQRMSAVRIVDSWLLEGGESSTMVASSRLSQIKVARYTERKPTMKRKKPAVKKTSKPAVTANAAPKKKIMPKVKEEVIVPGLPGEEPGAPGMDFDTGMPSDDMFAPAGDSTALPGDEMGMDDMGGMDAGGDTGMDDMGGMDAGGDMGDRKSVV